MMVSIPEHTWPEDVQYVDRYYSITIYIQHKSFSKKCHFMADLCRSNLGEEMIVTFKESLFSDTATDISVPEVVLY